MKDAAQKRLDLRIEEKNVFISTFYRYNYGSVLQAYALQSIFQWLGCKPVIVGLAPRSLDVTKEEQNMISRFAFFFRQESDCGPVRKIKRYVQRKQFIEKKRKIEQFVNERLSVCEYENIEKLTEIGDITSGCYVAGSDQVWNVVNRPLQSQYSLQWVSSNETHHKFSYAASLGQERISAQAQEILANAISDYDCVSFREQSALTMMRTKLDNESRIDIDPTLLLDSSFWNPVVAEKIVDYKYVYVYMLHNDYRLIKMARRIAKEKKLKIVFTGLFANQYVGVETRVDIGVEEFLSCIKNAEIVITNSFHGTAFSLLFHIPFVSVEVPIESARAKNLLSFVNLNNHYIRSIADCYIANETIDFQKVDELINQERKKSESYIKFIAEVAKNMPIHS